MCRLIQSGDPLYLPVTQDPVPKTEDQLEEDAQVMMQLGTDKYASEMRARMMSASLLSDMESFKVRAVINRSTAKLGNVQLYNDIHFARDVTQAANPGAVLEDFIRWYSPRDWVDDEGLDEWGQAKGQHRLCNVQGVTSWFHDNIFGQLPCHLQFCTHYLAYLSVGLRQLKI